MAKLGNFSRLPSAAVFDRRVSKTALRVLAAIGVYSDKSGVCYPGVKTLARRLGVTRPAVQRQLRKLEQLGYLVTKHRSRGIGGYGSNLYQIEYPRPHDMPLKGNVDETPNGIGRPQNNDDNAPTATSSVAS